MNNPTNVDRLKAGAVALRVLGRPGDEHAARMLELCEPIATHWTEPYAAPFVPLLESALRLAKSVTTPGEPAPTEQSSPERIATYRLDHCGNCRDAEFYGYGQKMAAAAHAKHVPIIEDGCGPLAGQPCACATCAAV